MVIQTLRDARILKDVRIPQDARILKDVILQQQAKKQPDLGKTLKQAAFSNGLFEEKIKIIIMKRYAPKLYPANR
ncbi:MAG: hypothetical protein II627_09525 [Lachnospiraceae bacterium]|nr:hypothetical protein [Lachnospiraceae bacterium]